MTMEKLTLEHITSLIDKEEYEIDPQVISCRLSVGEAVIIGTSYCFHQNHQDVERGKQSARKKAVDQLFELEAYHQKRLRPKTA